MTQYIFAGMIGGMVLLGSLYLISAVQDWCYSRRVRLKDELKEEIRRQLDSARGV